MKRFITLSTDVKSRVKLIAFVNALIDQILGDRVSSQICAIVSAFILSSLLLNIPSGLIELMLVGENFVA